MEMALTLLGVSWGLIFWTVVLVGDAIARSGKK